MFLHTHQSRAVVLALSLLLLPALQPALASTSETDRQYQNRTEPTASKSASPAAITKTSSDATGSSASHNKNVPPPFPVAGKFSRTVQTVSGINLVGTLIADEIAGSVAKKKLGGHVKVRIKVFSITDLIAGKVKSISISTAHGSVKGVPIGAAKLSSSGPIWFNYRHHTQQAYGLTNPASLNVSGRLQQTDVCHALESDAVTRAMRGLKLDLPGLGDQQLKMLSPKVILADDKITINTTLICEGADPDTGVNLSIKAKPVLVGSKVMLENMEVSSPDIQDPASFSKFTQDLFNPIVDFARFDRSTQAFRPSKCCIEGDFVSLSGSLLLVPRGYLAQATKATPPSISSATGAGTVSPPANSPPPPNVTTNAAPAAASPAIPTGDGANQAAATTAPSHP